MLNALRCFGKSFSPADLSSATLAAGARSIAITSVRSNLGVGEDLKYVAPVNGSINRHIIPTNVTLNNYSLICQNQQRLALSQNSLLPIHNGKAAGGRNSVTPGIQRLYNQAALPSSLN